MNDHSTVLLKRKEFTDISTIGDITFDGEWICYSLEDTVRKEGEKVYGKTAIPMGKYELAISFSNKFKKELPLLLSVPNFDGVRIHSGNTADDSLGCILVGKSKGKDYVGDSRTAFNELYPKIEHAMKNRKVIMEIS